MQRRAVQCNISLLFLFFCAVVSAESNQNSIFHVSGTVLLFGSPIGAKWVMFEGPLQKSVKVSQDGHYEADLPLGVWRVAVTASATSGMKQGSRLSHPRVFRVSKSTNVVIDLYTNGVGCGGVIIVTADGTPPTPEEEEQKDEGCQGREFFPLPSDDGVPFEVVVGGRGPRSCSRDHENRADCEREFGTYNLLTVYADKVTFTPFPRGGLLEAEGNVVIHEGSRESHKTSSRFLLVDGQALEAY